MRTNNSVILVNHSGSDETVALTAWASTMTDVNVDLTFLPVELRQRVLFDETVITKKKSVEDLLMFLGKHKHETPFESTFFQFMITSDIATHIQVLKHRIGTSCLSGSNSIQFLTSPLSEALPERLWTINELWEKWNSEDCTWFYRREIRSMRLESLDESTGQPTFTFIKDVMYMGDKSVFKYSIGDTNIECTEDHRVLTDKGWITIGEANQSNAKVALKTEDNVILYCNIDSCEFVDVQPVYDLEVESDYHNFLCNNVVVHNCNTESARYKELSDKWLIPDDWSSSYSDVVRKWADILEKTTSEAHRLYHQAVTELTPELGRKRAKESARFFLPYNKQVTYYLSVNLRSLAHFVKLRASGHAQKEIELIALDMVSEILTHCDVPISLKALGILDVVDEILNIK